MSQTLPARPDSRDGLTFRLWALGGEVLCLGVDIPPVLLAGGLVALGAGWVSSSRRA